MADQVLKNPRAAKAEELLAQARAELARRNEQAREAARQAKEREEKVAQLREKLAPLAIRFLFSTAAASAPGERYGDPEPLRVLSLQHEEMGELPGLVLSTSGTRFESEKNEVHSFHEERGYVFRNGEYRPRR